MKKIILIPVVLLIISTTSSAEELRDLLVQAMDHYRAGSCVEALPVFSEILDAELTQIKNDRKLDYALNYYAGYCARQTGEPDVAVKYLERALALSVDRSQLPVLNTFLGEAERERGNFSIAEAYYRRALTYLEPGSEDAALTWFYLAEAHRGMKNYESALADCNKSLEISTALGNPKLEVMCMTHIGEVHYERGEYPEAIRMFTGALTLSRNAQLPMESANNLMGMALVSESLGTYDLARQNYHEALRLYTASGVTVNIPLIANHLMALPRGTEDASSRAAVFYAQQADMIIGTGDYDAILWMEVLTGEYLVRAGDTDGAIRTLQAASEQAAGEGFTSQAVRGYLILAELYAGDNNYADAMGYLIDAEHFLDMLKEREYLPSVYAAQGNIYERLERWPQAEDRYQMAIDASEGEARANYSAMLESMREQMAGKSAE